MDSNNFTKSALPAQLSTIFFYLAILFFIIGFSFTDVPPGPFWYQQFMPNLNNQILQDINFIDSLNGWALTKSNTSGDTSFVLRTTTRGDSWNIVTRVSRPMSRIIFMNQNTGYVSGSIYYNFNFHFLKTTNSGISWDTISAPVRQADMFVLNVDTIWIVDDNGLSGGVYRTTNGGGSWLFQHGFPSNPNKIYMFDKNLGFAGENFTLQRTTDGGFNWTQIVGEIGFKDMYFADSLTGWKSNADPYQSDSSISRTTNSGINWVRQHIPSGGNLSIFNSMREITKISADTILGTGGSIQVGFNDYRGIIYKTTNAGNNWLFQIPDTSFRIPGYVLIDFTNTNTGWAYLSSTGIHTTNGGDTTLYLPINLISANVPKQFSLYQNFPNPFNPNTKIRYDVKGQTAEVKIIIYDILGKTISTPVNQKQNAGTYEVDFSGGNMASGIYFYSLIVDGNLIDTKKMLMVK